jgi:hypothetical protein
VLYHVMLALVFFIRGFPQVSFTRNQVPGTTQGFRNQVPHNFFFTTEQA